MRPIALRVLLIEWLRPHTRRWPREARPCEMQGAPRKGRHRFLTTKAESAPPSERGHTHEATIEYCLLHHKRPRRLEGYWRSMWP